MKQFNPFPEDKFQVIHDFLYHSGKRNKELTPSQHDNLMVLCDGYGKQSIKYLGENGLLWDFSHVRDSSDEALESVYFKIVAWGLVK